MEGETLIPEAEVRIYGGLPNEDVRTELDRIKALTEETLTEVRHMTASPRKQSGLREQPWNALGGQAAILIPVAIISEGLAYLFNIGWAFGFSIPFGLVPMHSSLLVVIIAGAVLVGAVTLFVWGSKAGGTQFDWSTAILRVVAKPIEIGLIIVVLAIAFFSSGYLMVNMWWSWSFIGSQCVVVANFGDTVVAADIERDTNRVGTDFTTYHMDSLPQFWQANAFLTVISPDSEHKRTPIMSCPTAQRSGVPYVSAWSKP